MSLLINQPIDIGNGIIYTSVAQHRININDRKSRWTITIEQELNCFKLSIIMDWFIETIGWGLHLNDSNKIEVLGFNRLSENLYFAKFLDPSTNANWHGWPADYRRMIQDRPPTKVLELWQKEGKIEKHHFAKIQGGKICSL